MSSPQDKTAVTNVGIPGLEALNGSGALSGEQLMSVLQKLGITSPVLNKLAGEGGTINDKDAAQTLSNLAQAGHIHIPLGLPGVPGGPEPGPSSHPRGPPNLGQGGPSGPMNLPPAPIRGGPGPQPQPPKEDISEPIEPSSPGSEPSKHASSLRQRGSGRAAMGTDEWARQRKDNHKEVERRRRGNINEGINELGRIVPNGSGEKSKGAILSRAVQYIHHLKENEARNIEKWTLEKLLMDQAMGDLQSQLEEVRKLWEEERATRQRIEAELDSLKGTANE
jgi:hypothetical protein